MALDQHLSAEEFGESFGDHQAEAGALLFVSAAIELSMGSDFGDLLGGHAAAMIGDGEGDAVSRQFAGDANLFASFGEFESVIDEFFNDLFKIVIGNAEFDWFQIELEIGTALILLGDFLRQRRNEFVRADRRGRSRNFDALQFAGHEFDLGIDQKVLDQAMQARSRLMNEAGVFEDLFGRHGRMVLDHEAGQAEDAMKRSAQFMRQRERDVAAQ